MLGTQEKERPSRTAPPPDRRLSRRRLPATDLDAPVALVRRVVRRLHREVRLAPALDLHAAAADTLALQVVGHGLGALLRELQVVLRRTRRVGVAPDQHS